MYIGSEAGLVVAVLSEAIIRRSVFNVKKAEFIKNKQTRYKRVEILTNNQVTLAKNRNYNKKVGATSSDKQERY